MVLQGSCHCGRLSVTFTTERAVEELPLRACQCTFCRRHGGLTTSDPEGEIVLRVRGPAPRWYRFGSGATDFWICPDCGVYVGAGVESEGRRYAVVNVRALDEAKRFTQAPAPMVYDAETPGERLGRRARVWSPARIESTGG
jgi:hypothetical protein